MLLIVGCRASYVLSSSAHLDAASRIMHLHEGDELLWESRGPLPQMLGELSSAPIPDKKSGKGSMIR